MILRNVKDNNEHNSEYICQVISALNFILIIGNYKDEEQLLKFKTCTMSKNKRALR